jgi:hypothetical protein
LREGTLFIWLFLVLAPGFALLPPGFFPEGWSVYGFLAIYAGVGIGLVMSLGWLPRRQAPV